MLSDLRRTQGQVSEGQTRITGGVRQADKGITSAGTTETGRAPDPVLLRAGGQPKVSDAEQKRIQDLHDKLLKTELGPLIQALKKK